MVAVKASPCCLARLAPVTTMTAPYGGKETSVACERFHTAGAHNGLEADEMGAVVRWHALCSTLPT